jgi:hypothetical protein
MLIVGECDSSVSGIRIVRVGNQFGESVGQMRIHLVAKVLDREGVELQAQRRLGHSASLSNCPKPYNTFTPLV